MLRTRIQDLEKFKYVLGYKVEAYQAELLPKTEEAARLAQELAVHDKELASELMHIKELRKELGDRDRSIRSLKTEIGGMR
jgi:predicted RNase H-like nuclease (RuvC/YqgF family)